MAVVVDTAAALCLQGSQFTLQCNIFRWPTWYRLIRTETSTIARSRVKPAITATDAGRHRRRREMHETYPAVAAIAGHVACYPDKAEISIFPG